MSPRCAEGERITDAKEDPAKAPSPALINSQLNNVDVYGLGTREEFYESLNKRLLCKDEKKFMKRLNLRFVGKESVIGSKSCWTTS